jgi:prepilin-type processing-associated H-X9-DG protein
MLMYANENHGHLPMAVYTPGQEVAPAWGTGTAAANPFGPNGPVANDVTAAMFLLLRTQDITPEVFICPSSNAEKDNFGGATDGAARRSNFTDWRKNLSYSMHNPYVSDGVLDEKGKTTWWTMSLPADFALAADLNPGTFASRDARSVSLQSKPDAMRKANSTNHEGDGQNVLYGDGHVEFQNNPLCGVERDNIYTNRQGEVTASPADANDSVLLPAQDW